MQQEVPGFVWSQLWQVTTHYECIIPAQAWLNSISKPLKCIYHSLLCTIEFSLLHSHHSFFCFESVDTMYTEFHLSRLYTFRCSQLIPHGCCYINKMNFCHWEPPGGSGRIWSENIDGSIVRGQPTQRGHPSWPLEELGSLMTGMRVQCHWQWHVSEHLGGTERNPGLPGITWGAGNKSGSADIMPGGTWKYRQQPWEHLNSLSSSQVKTSSSLGILLVCLEIIATTYHSTIFKTHIFCLYSHLCICVSI